MGDRPFFYGLLSTGEPKLIFRLPPQISRVGRWGVNEIGHLGRELIRHTMTIRVKHHGKAAAPEIMPDAFRVHEASITVPNPVTLEVLVHGAFGKVRGFHWTDRISDAAGPK